MERLTSLLFICIVHLSSATEIMISNTTDGDMNVTCNRGHEYDHLDIRDVMGKWRAVELYTHLRREGVKTYISCPTATIWEEPEFPRSTYGVCTCNFC